MRYDKYDNEGALHWAWYASNEHQYRDLVDDVLEVFDTRVGSIVDIGSGDGRILSLLAAQGFHCTGVEPEARGIALAQEKGVDATLLHMEAERFATIMGTHDYLLCFNTIEHIDDPTCLHAIMRRIRQFGVFTTNIPDGGKSKYHVREYTPAELRAFFEDAGFQVATLPIAVPGYHGVLVKRP